MDSGHRKFISQLSRKTRARRESGLFVVEGARTAGELDPSMAEEVFVTREFLEGPGGTGSCRRLLEKKGYTVVTASEMEQMADTVTPQGILLTVRQRSYRSLRAFAAAEREYAAVNVPGPPLLILLESLQDPGNLGTILRMSEAAGVTGIIADSATADVYSPKVVRATMGAVMRIPYMEMPAEGLGSVISAMHSMDIRGWEHIKVAAAALSEDAAEYTSCDYTEPCAVAIGNEAHGLTGETTGLADICIIIPMLGHTESLNAAVAASVIAFEAARQRRLST